MLGSNDEWNCWANMEQERGLAYFQNAWAQCSAGGTGLFQTYIPCTDYTRAVFLGKAEKKTRVSVKFVSLEGNSVDTDRDTKGMAIKFHTEAGDLDLLCSGYPVAPYGDCAGFCDYIRAIRPDEASNLVDEKRYWQYTTGHQTAVHHLMFRYSDLGTRKNYGKMEWFGQFPHEWINQNGELHLVRYVLRPLSGIACIHRQEAEFLAGFDPAIARRTLHDTLVDGMAVEYEVLVQVISENRMRATAFDPCNLTCRWSGDMATEIAIGKLSIQNPCLNYEKELASACFSLRQVVDGIRLPNVPLVRLITMLESKKVVGACPDVFSLEEYGKSAPNQEPYVYQQAAGFYEGLSAEQRDHLRGNLLDQLIFMEDEIQRKLVETLYQVSIPLAKEMEKGLTF